MAAAEAKGVQRSLRVDLAMPADRAEDRKRVVASVRAYRACLRHCYGLMAESRAAGAEITWTGDECRVTPSNNNAKVLAALAHGQATAEVVVPEERKRGDGEVYQVKIPRGPVYELRAEVARQLPTMLAFVNDSARRDLQTAWQARDPEFPQATRGWLVLQGARGLAQFNRRGIGLPVATAKPRLDKRALVLRWDRDIGEVAFQLTQNLDGGRWRVWQALRDGADGWKLGTVFLSEVDGKLFATVSHERPRSAADLDPARTLVVTPRDGATDLVPEGRRDPSADLPLFGLAGPDGAETADTLGAADVRAFLAYAANRRAALERRRGDCGSPRRPWGFGKGWAVNQATLARATAQREEGQKARNHAWTRRIADRARQWRCGIVRVAALPTRSFNGGPPVGCLAGHPWNWTQFRQSLRYKLEEMGCVVVFADEEE
jgi:hypothetical protein